jgi:hypothetical protein
VLQLFHRSHLARRAAVLAAVAALCGAAFAAAWAARPDEPSFDTVGAIDGEDILVSGSMKMEVDHGHVKSILRSGSDVQVKSGQATIKLVEGGTILICGPAHFSVLKSAESLTLALDFGVIHARIERQPTLTIYTAQIQATPVAIGDGAQDALVGFEAGGAICIRATSGAVRLEQQFTGQNVIVPQGGDVLVNNGQLDSLRTGAGHCLCESPVARSAPPVAPSPEVSMLATNKEIEKRAAAAKQAESQPVPQTAPAPEEPIYQVFMPPLTYGANAKVQAEFDPKLILLVRRVRVRPTLIFQGRVEGDPVAVASDTAPQKPPSADSHSTQNITPKPAQPGSGDSMYGRVRSFIRRLWTRSS